LLLPAFDSLGCCLALSRGLLRRFSTGWFDKATCRTYLTTPGVNPEEMICGTIEVRKPESGTSMAPLRTRVLHFPDEESAGTLKVTTDRPEGSWVHLPARTIGPAQGTVTCTMEAGETLWLHAILTSERLPAALAELPPAALDGLYTGATSDPENLLSAIGQLTGLRLLALHTSPAINGTTLAPLGALSGLECLILLGLRNSTGLGSTLMQWPALRSLLLGLCPVREEHAAALATLTQLEYLEVIEKDVVPSLPDYLTSLVALRTLYLDGCPLGDGNLAALRDLPALRCLWLVSAQVTDAGLPTVGQLAALQHFSLAYAPISDAGLGHLARLTELEGLGLFATPVTDAGIRELSDLRRLKFLNLGRTQTGDEAMRWAGTLTALERLDAGEQVTNAGLAALTELKQLRWLRLVGSRVSDAGLDHLPALTGLRVLYTGTGVTEAKVAWLQQQLPDCRIHPA
jgi:hypothetical protein